MADTRARSIAVVERTRLPADEANPFIAMERAASESISHALEACRKVRDAASEQLFSTLYGSKKS